ncbi:hypothetical protein R1sor_019219 [Riccia sorocarpa]|uniref:EamA domain-containing protein n=1 Tax=Riccia sorocarpa TaxID=122646 RepID=A0ABD3IEM2_9MARC
MLSRANLFGKVRPADETKCLGSNRRSQVLKVDNHPQSKATSQCHGSDSSTTKLVRISRSPSSSTDGNSVLEHEQPCYKALTVKDRRSIPNNREIRSAAARDIKEVQLAGSKPGRRILQASDYHEEGNVEESLLWRSTELASMDPPQKRAGDQKRKDLSLKEVQACFSNSLSMQLMTEQVKQAYLSGAQAEFEVPGVCTNLRPMDALDSGVNADTLNEMASARNCKGKKCEREIGGLLLLNGLAAIYGSSNVASKYVAEAAPALPASLASVVKFTSALTFFIPALVSVLRNHEVDLLRAGAELGSLTFAASFLDSCNPAHGGSSSSIPSLFFAFKVVFVPLMELSCGHQPGLKLTRVATIGMGLLEEEGLGPTGIACPQICDLWGLAVSVILALHFFRSEALGKKFDPLKLNAVQCGVLAILSLGWEVWSSLSDASSTTAIHLFSSSGCSLDSLHCIPWVPLIYSGLVCSGLCSWLELRSLQSIHVSTATLVYTTIPLWGALLSSFTNGANADFSTDLALTCGLAVVASCSFCTHFMSSGDDEGQDFKVLKSAATSSTEKKSAVRVKSSTSITAESTDVHKSLNLETTDGNSDLELTGKDYFPAGLLVSQLKFPYYAAYYAAQAKGLLAEIKFKLGALKSLGLVFTGIQTTTSSRPRDIYRE